MLHLGIIYICLQCIDLFIEWFYQMLALNQASGQKNVSVHQ